MIFETATRFFELTREVRLRLGPQVDAFRRAIGRKRVPSERRATKVSRVSFETRHDASQRQIEDKWSDTETPRSLRHRGTLQTRSDTARGCRRMSIRRDSERFQQGSARALGGSPRSCLVSSDPCKWNGNSTLALASLGGASTLSESVVSTDSIHLRAVLGESLA
jgi:hypothetical protein